MDQNRIMIYHNGLVSYVNTDVSSEWVTQMKKDFGIDMYAIYIIVTTYQ